MRNLKFVAALIGALLAAAPAIAQTSPGLTKGQVLTAGQWNNLFASKQDTLGFTPLNLAGGIMTGRLVTAPSGATTSGLNLTPGSVPASPSDGDLWVTTGGLFARVNGATVGPISGATSASFAGTSPIGVTFPAGVVTYAFNFSIPNTFLAQQTNQGATTTSPGWYAQIAGDTFPRVRVGMNATDVASLALGPGNAARDVFIERVGAGSLRFGSPDAAAPVAQTSLVQSVVAGTSNTAGATRTIAGSQGTGTGVGGSILFQTAPAGGSGTAQNALVTAMTIFGSGGHSTGAATDQGAGTLNLAGSLYNNGTAPTGTGGYVRATSPALVTPALGVATGTSLALGGASIGTNALAVTGTTLLNNALTYGGVTLANTVTGTGSMVLGTSPSISAPTITTSLTYGGVTLANAVTGTGNMVLATSPSVSSLTVTSAFTATGLVTFADMATAAVSTTANYLAGTASTLVPASVIYTSETTTTFGATTTFDFSTFINTAVTLTGNITTQTLSNVQAGKAGTITFIQDGTGSRTTVWNSIFKFSAGVTPVLSTAAGAIDLLSYTCRSATSCVATLTKDVR